MAVKALRTGSLDDELRVVRGDRREDDACARALGVVDVGDEVGVALGEVLGHDRAAERLERLGEVVDQTLVIVGAEHRERVRGGHAQLFVGVVGEDRALERIEEADAVVHIAVRGDLRVGAGDADGGHARFGKDLAAGNGHAGAVGAEHDGHIAVHELRRGGRAVFGGGAVVDDLELDVIRLAADLDGGLDVVGVLHTQDLLLAAGAVVAGLRLVHADLYDFVAAFGGGGCVVGCVSCGLAARAACQQAQRQRAYKDQCKKLFHGFPPSRLPWQPQIAGGWMSLPECPHTADECSRQEHFYSSLL